MTGMQAVIMPKKTLQIIEESVIMNAEVVDETEVQEIFHISKKTLCNNVSSGKIPRRFYTIAFNGAKFFFLRKLLRLKPKKLFGTKTTSHQLQLPI